MNLRPNQKVLHELLGQKRILNAGDKYYDAMRGKWLDIDPSQIGQENGYFVVRRSCVVTDFGEGYRSFEHGVIQAGDEMLSLDFTCWERIDESQFGLSARALRRKITPSALVLPTQEMDP